MLDPSPIGRELEEVVAGRAVVVRKCAQIAEGAICDDGP